MQIIVDDLIIHYELKGKGEVVLIVHGWGDSSSGLHRLADQLSSHFEVLNVDLPGFGKSQAPKRTWGLDEYALFLSQLVKKLNLKCYAIIGHSNGGAIVIRGLRNKSLKADKLVLMASAGIRNEKNVRMAALQAITKTGKVFTAVLPKSAQRRIREKVYTSVGSDMLIAEHLQDSFKKIVADDIQKDAALIKFPTLLIYGDQDSSTPLRYGELLKAAIPISRLEIIPGAGHFVHLDDPSTVLNLIEEFLS